MRSLLQQADEAPITFLVALAYVTLAFLTDPFNPTLEQLMQHGASRGMEVQRGEAWRLLSSAFLHGGIVHLGFNTLVLVWIGPMLERSIGSIKFALLYAVGACGGSMAHTLWNHPYVPLVGGSGALFAMFGGILAMNMRSGRHLLSFLEHHGSRQLLGLIFFNLLLGWLLPMVSNSAHIGGLIGGFVLMFCFLRRGRAKTDRISRVVQAGWIALFASLLFYCCFPVVRWDYLMDRHNSALEAGDVAMVKEYSRAIDLSPEARENLEPKSKNKRPK